MFGLYNSVRAVHSIFNNVEGDTPELNVVKYTAAVFAQADTFIASLAWDVSGEPTPKHFHEQASNEAIKKQIDKVAGAGGVGNDADAIEKVFLVAKVVEEAAARLEPPGEILRPMLGDDFSKSKLDAQEALEEGIRKGLQVLHQALVQQLQCCDRGHLLRLRLTGFINQVDAQSRRYFDAYLSSRYIWTPPRWVQSRCIIASGLSNPERADCHFICDAEERNENVNILLEETLIQRAQLDDCPCIESPSAPTISLWELLRQGDSGCDISEGENPDSFSPGEKDMLCLNLALSLLHLSTSEWRLANWSSGCDTGRGIFFLRDPRTQRIVDKTHAYISYRLDHNSNLPSEDNLVCDRQLLDFAKLLMEIHMWKRLPLTHKRRRLTGNELHLYLLQRIDDPLLFPKRYEMFRKAVKACLDAAGREAAENESRDDRLPNYIFNYIVRPLDCYADFPEFSTSTPADSPPEAQETSLIPFFDYKEELETPEDKTSRGDAFLEAMDSFVEKYIKNPVHDEQLPEHRKQKIRIAVIDSGISRNDPILNNGLRKEKIKKCRNFSSPCPDDWDDTVGHGTMVARLLMQAAPEAELFIAKVTDSKRMPKSKLYCIAKAINWAVQVWNVDIITMSIALKEENPDIDEELNAALDPSYDGATRKIIFAAAGNNRGGNERQAWPARKDGVIGVYATDGLGKNVNINPSTKGDICFATLGRDIKLRRYDEDGSQNVYISGTSFATPIAASIAANIMEFARHRIHDLNKTRKRRLYSAGCMKKIFSKISVDMGDYHYLQPWSFWSEVHSAGEWEGISLRRNDPDNIVKVLSHIIARY